MRYTPAALALSLLVAVSASTSHSAAPQTLDPRAAQLENVGRGALVAGDAGKATDAFEAALVVQPGNMQLMLDLAEAARAQGMQGKALHYYHGVLALDPQNLSAIAGEGAALAEKGAVEKARHNLAQLQGLCGADCGVTRQLAQAIARAPAPRVVSVDVLKPKVEASN